MKYQIIKKLLIFLLLTITGIYCKDSSSNISVTIALLTIDRDLRKAKPIINELFKLSKDPKIKGLIIYIDSRGGSIGTSQLLFSELKKFQQKKPVIVVVEDFCLSGAYYMAIGSDFIIALPNSEIGSIGALYTINKYKDIQFNEEKTSGKREVTIIKAGKHKDLGNPYTPLQKWHLKYYKEQAQKIYNQFIFDVSRARNLSIVDEKLWADGQIFFGTEAVALGLIDAIGDFSDALEKMKELLQRRGIKVQGEFEIIDVKYE